MRRKNILIWALCAALIVCGLLACLLFCGKNDETAKSQQKQGTDSASVEKESAPFDEADISGKESQSDQSTSDKQTEDNNKKEDSDISVNTSADSELPEIEIPIIDDNKDDGEERGHEDAGQEPSETDKPTNSSSGSKKTQPDGADNNGQNPASETDSEQAEDNDVVIDNNGDILLPVIP